MSLSRKHKIRTKTFQLPSHWACPLINGDSSGLDSQDQQALDDFTDWMLAKYGQCDCVDVSEDQNFVSWHDARAFGVLPADCADFTFLI